MLRLCRTRAEIVAVTGPHDAFARWDLPATLDGWVLGSAVGVLRTSAARAPSLFAWGAGVGDLLTAVAPDLAERGVSGVSVPWPDRRQIDRVFTVTGGGDWHWMWTDRPTGVDLTAVLDPTLTLVDLDDTRDAAEITDLGAENPRFEGFPGTGHSEQWIGVRTGDGDLVACGAMQRLPSGTAHLGGILVTHRYRGRGVGLAVSAALTDRVIETEGVSTLGVYADNVTARTLYERLGYRSGALWASRRVHHIATTPGATTGGAATARAPDLGCGYD